jgi:hypothetical protein
MMVYTYTGMEHVYLDVIKMTSFKALSNEGTVVTLMAGPLCSKWDTTHKRNCQYRNAETSGHYAPDVMEHTKINIFC